MFSVIVPVHNKLPHIERCVGSVLNQSFANFELILVDDASTDGSSEKLLEFTDKRIQILRRDVPGRGGYAARNLGIQRATFSWISFLDADDEWDIDLLQRVYDVIANHPDAGIVSCGWAEKVEGISHSRSLERGQGEIKTFVLEDFLRKPELMWTGGISMKKAVLIEAGLFPTCPECKAGGDFDTWIRALDVSPKNFYVDEILSFYFRDSVNRVTDFSRNPNDHFCAGGSLRRIYATATRSSLKEAIRAFVNLQVYVILKRLISSGHTPTKKLLTEFYRDLRLPMYLAKLSTLFVLKSVKRLIE